MYENGEREPGFELLETIADYFNVDMNYLLGKKDSSQQKEQGYYLDEDARDMAQFLFDNPEYKVLLDATRKTKKEDILFVKEMIDRINSGRK